MRVRMGVRWGAVVATFGAMTMLATPSTARADHLTPYRLGAVLTGAQEVPPFNPSNLSPATSPATGMGSVFYNTGAGTLDVTIAFSGLLAPTLAVAGAPAHLHLAAPGQNGPVVLPLAFVPVGVTSFAMTTQSFALGGLDPQLASELQRVAALVAGGQAATVQLYFNVHTDPGTDGLAPGWASGELRGNLAVVPEPSTYALMATGLAGVGVAARRRRRA